MKMIKMKKGSQEVSVREDEVPTMLNRGYTKQSADKTTKSKSSKTQEVKTDG